MVRCHHVDDVDHDDTLVVRVFGDAADFDRDNEVMGHQVAHAAGCGMPLVALFENGLVCGFAKNCKNIEYNDLCDHQIAR